MESESLKRDPALKKVVDGRWRAANKESIVAYQAAWWAQNRERKLAERKEQRAAARALLPPPPAYVPPVEKACVRCQVVKPLLDFGKGQCRDGRDSWCRPCKNAYGAASLKLRRATDPAFRETLAARKRDDRRAADPALSERDALRLDCKTHVAAWRAWLKTLGRANAHVRAWKAARKQHAQEKRKSPVPAPLPNTFEYHFARAYERCKSSIRRARRKGGRVAGVGLKQLLPYYLRAVQLERRTGISWDVDHTCAYADGGKHEPANLQILPRVMNEAKGARSATIPLGVPTHQELEDAWLL